MSAIDKKTNCECFTQIHIPKRVVIRNSVVNRCIKHLACTQLGGWASKSKTFLLLNCWKEISLSMKPVTHKGSYHLWVHAKQDFVCLLIPIPASDCVTTAVLPGVQVLNLFPLHKPNYRKWALQNYRPLPAKQTRSRINSTKMISYPVCKVSTSTLKRTQKLLTQK